MEPAVLYNETETSVNITEVEELINETIIVPAQVTPTGTTFRKFEQNVAYSHTYLTSIQSFT